MQEWQPSTHHMISSFPSNPNNEGYSKPNVTNYRASSFREKKQEKLGKTKVNQEKRFLAKTHSEKNDSNFPHEDHIKCNSI